MNKVVLRKIKAQLLQEKELLLAKQANAVDIDLSGDEIDVIQGNIIANTQKQLDLRNKMRIQSIETALSKIESGKYGLCYECDDQISIERLRINPTYSLCISCAEEVEMVSRRKH